MFDPYRTLEIPRDATAGEIKTAYFRLVRKYSPEQHPEKFKSIRAAYEQLRTVAKRAEAELMIIKEPSGDFAPPDTAYQPGVTAEDFHDVMVALYSDLKRNDFSQDFTEIS